jgi:hypothetical protein
MAQSENVFLTKSERQAIQTGPSVAQLQAKIGELTMENDFLEKALSLKATCSGKLDGPSAKR